MKDQVNEKTGEGAADGPAKAERKRQIEADGEPGVVRVKLPQAIGLKAKEVVAELRTRGAQVTVDELLAAYLEGVPPRYFDDQILQRTPEPYYLEAAARVPELREMLIRHAKKGLMRTVVPVNDNEPKRRRKKTADINEAATPSALVPGIES